MALTSLDCTVNVRAARSGQLAFKDFQPFVDVVGQRVGILVGDRLFDDLGKHKADRHADRQENKVLHALILQRCAIGGSGLRKV